MRVLLIAPTAGYKTCYPTILSLSDFPSGIAYLAAALKQAGHEVFGLNPNNIIGYPSAHTMVEDKITQKIQEVNPDLIGIGGLCTDYAFIRDAMQIIRHIAPEVPIVIGGGIVTNDAEYIFNLLKPDFAIVGEGEEAIVQIADAISNYKGYESIANLWYWGHLKAEFTKSDYNYPSIDSRPFPDYEPFGIKDMLDNYSMATRLLYRYHKTYPRPFVLTSSRSCPFNCTFCQHGHGAKYRARSISNILEEIKIMYERYQFNILIILDELFAVNKKRMIEFCNALIKARQTYGWDFDWMFQTHASAALDKDTLLLVKKAGCFLFSYGLESASPCVLESMNKKTKPSQIIEAIHLANETNIGFGGNFIFGDKAETQDTILETIDFLVRHGLDIHILLDALRPYPGSKLFEDCIARGIIKDKLDFYEHIDEHPWNMTSMPDKTFLPLVDTIVSFGGLFPWVKSVSPYRYKVENESRYSPIVLHSGKQVYKIWAKCPHCGKDFYSRELLALGGDKTQNINVAPIVEIQYPSLIKRVTTLLPSIKYSIVKACRLANLYYFGFTNPIYRRLKSSIRNKGYDLFWDSFFANVWFATGCPHCNRRIKITIPINPFRLVEVRRRLNLP